MTKVIQATWDRQDPKGLKANRDLLDHKERRVSLEHKVNKEHWGLRGRKVTRVMPGRWA